MDFHQFRGSVVVSSNITLSQYDMQNKGRFVLTAGCTAITLPSPNQRMRNSITRFRVANNTDSAVTASCTNGFAQGGDSVSIPSGTSMDFSVYEDGAGGYIYDVHAVGAPGTMVFGTTESTACVGNDARLPVAVAVFVPTPAWTTHNPTISSSAFRQRTIQKKVEWSVSYVLSDGKDSAGLALTFPAGMVPADTEQIIPCKALVKIGSGAFAEKPAWVDCRDATATNRVLNVLTGTLTDTETAEIHVSGSHEIP